MSATFTQAPWSFGRMESAAELAALRGETLEPHQGYYRDNNGDWIVTWKDEDGDGGRIAAVSFKGSAKRGQAYSAPDPEGQANARLIAAAPELYEALAECSRLLRDIRRAGGGGSAISATIERAGTVLTKARGE